MHEFKNAAISTKKKEKKNGEGGWEGLLIIWTEGDWHREEKRSS